MLNSLKIPTHKHQMTNKSQIQNSNTYHAGLELCSLVIGICLSFWLLRFGIC